MRRRAAARVQTSSLIALVAVLSASGCGDADDGTGGGAGGSSDCPVGSDNCDCTEGLGCDPGLGCAAGTCSPKTPICGDGVLDEGEECDLGGALNSDEGACRAGCVVAFCGDGFVGIAEGCDDGNSVDDDDCTNGCTSPSCGDGVVQTPEVCDDGNDDEDDECTTLCKPPVCGDGVLQSSEDCDLGPDNSNTGSCTFACESAECGDGFVQPSNDEQCDDSNANDDDTCKNDCRLNGECAVGALDCLCTVGMGCDPDLVCEDGICVPQTGSCGDGALDPGEQCDLGAALNSNTGICKVDCTAQECGDGFVGPSEGCDDGNLVNNDACTNICQSPSCGDAVEQVGEQCDDGNTSNADACTTLCKPPTCGDGFLQSGEQCDDGMSNSNTGSCTGACLLATCGDGFAQSQNGEQCDDGNNVNTDGCTSACLLPLCGDGAVQALNSEECDDGNGVDTDGCTSACRLPRCGDGIITTGIGEQCDDANVIDTDLCTNGCRSAACGDGIVSSSAGEQCDDANVDPADACTYPSCQSRRCGDGIVAPAYGETCDDGNTSDDDTCTTECRAPQCGDGLLSPSLGEACDDGGTAFGDGCDTQCQSIVSLVSGTGAQHNCFQLSTGVVRCWGFNSTYQLGYGGIESLGDEPNELAPFLANVNVGLSDELAIGERNSCSVVRTTHALRCWGDFSAGQGGRESIPPTGSASSVMLYGRSAQHVAIGRQHICALLDDASIRCWGANNAGQLGQGDTTNRGNGAASMNFPSIALGAGRTATAIAAGGDTSCAILDNGHVKCWGANDLGQLGQGDVNPRGDNPAEMGDALAPVDLGSRTAQSISVGAKHVCVTTTGGAALCWGSNASGELGRGDVDARGDNPNELGATLSSIPLAEPIARVAAGTSFTCAVSTTQQVYCWGLGSSGQLGSGSTANLGDAPGEVASLAPVPLGTGRLSTQLAVGQAHVCSLLDNGQAKCWGAVANGACGLPPGNNRGDGPNEMGNALPVVFIP